MNALGVHVFAGGFTMGVQQVCPVIAQLETHNFGRETAEQFVDFINADSWEDWPRLECSFIYGNPRCTGFSCITSGYGGDVHGPWSGPTKDIHDLCNYGVRNETDVIIWESVQQAYSTGRELLDYLRDELFVPRGYRIVHAFLNAASFGNPQNRRRYFFIAYRGHRNFNFAPPVLSPSPDTTRSTIERFKSIDVQPCKLNSKKFQYSPDSCIELTKDERLLVPHLREGECCNRFARFRNEELKTISPRLYNTWKYRASNMPFSMHCIQRIRYDWYTPTIHSSAARFIHPELNRPLSVRELAALMGWPKDVFPKGPNPVGQIAKGVVPSAGRWLAEQVQLYLNDEWGSEDWESKYNHTRGEWVGSSCPGKVEKTFNMTHYTREMTHERLRVD